MSPRLLIAEDAADVAEVIAYTARLVWPNAKITMASSGREALDVLREDGFDLAVLDVTMPPPDGFEVCRLLRERGSTVRILMLTVRGATVDKVRAFDLGADDYLTKPFDPLELQARLRALLRRHPLDETRDDRPTCLAFGDLQIDHAGHEVRLGDASIDLTPTEYRMLIELARNAGTVMSHEALRDRVWGPDRYGDPSDLKVFVRRLRQKLDDDPHHPRFIETVRGFGYRFLKSD